jgi:hypothetical protein
MFASRGIAQAGYEMSARLVALVHGALVGRTPPIMPVTATYDTLARLTACQWPSSSSRSESHSRRLRLVGQTFCQKIHHLNNELLARANKFLRDEDTIILFHLRICSGLNIRGCRGLQDFERVSNLMRAYTTEGWYRVTQRKQFRCC